MSKAPYHWQGSLDGLCGYYAIVNALTVCGVLKTFEKQQKLFRDLFKEAPEIYGGLKFNTMRTFLEERQRSWPSIVIQPPLADLEKNSDIDEYLGEILSSKNVKCAIIKIQRKCDDWDDHWVVIKRNGQKVQFLDSACQDGEPYKVKNQSSLRLGRHKDENANEWHIINRNEAVIFESKSKMKPAKNRKQL